MFNKSISKTIARLFMVLSLALAGLLALNAKADANEADTSDELETGESHYLIMFGSQASIKLPSRSHTWATMVTISADGSKREETISWLPIEGYFAPGNAMPLTSAVPGRNYDLDETLQLTRNRSVNFWGPFQVTEVLYQSFVRRKQQLDAGQIRYKMIVSDPGKRAFLSNCIMAVSESFGYFRTGTDHGFSASLGVLKFFAPQILNFPWVARPEIINQLRINDRIRNR